jgi:hypothetical protein
MRPTDDQLWRALNSGDGAVRQLAVNHIENARPNLLPMLLELLRGGRPVGTHDYTPNHAASMLRTAGDLDEYLSLLPVIRERWLAGGTMLRDPVDTLCAELPLDVLKARQTALRAKTLCPKAHRTMHRRLGWLRRSPRSCLAALSAFGRRYADKPQERPREVEDMTYALQSAARDPQAAREWLLPLLPRLEVLPDHDPQGDLVWLSHLAIELAGLAGVEEYVPLLVRCLASEDDWILEACDRALPRLMDSSVLARMDAAFDDTEGWFRYMAASVAAKVPLKETVATFERWFDVCSDPGDLATLAYYAIDLLDSDLLPVVERVVIDVEWDSMQRDYGEDLAAAYAIFGRHLRYPDLVKQATERAKNRHDRTWGRLRQRLVGELKSIPEVEPRLAATYAPQSTTVRVGPNDPCVCGSGRKFKKCCMNQTAMRR